MNYLKRFLAKESTDVLFVGYQAVGTLGRQIQEAAKGGIGPDRPPTRACPRPDPHPDRLFGPPDQSDLLRFVKNMPECHEGNSFGPW